MKMISRRSSLRPNPWLPLAAIWMQAQSGGRLRKQRPAAAKRIQSPPQRKNEIMTNPGYRIIAALAFRRLLTAALSSATSAQSSELQVCNPDFKCLYADVSPGNGRVVACLHAHSEALSEPRKDAFAELGK